MSQCWNESWNLSKFLWVTDLSVGVFIYGFVMTLTSIYYIFDF